MTDVSTESTFEESDLLPDDLDYTNADVQRDTHKPKLRAETLYRFKVTGAKTRVWPKGTIYSELVVNPMDPDGKTRSPSTRLKLNMPFANPKKAGHTAPDSFWMWHKVLSALYPQKYTAFPTRQKDGTFLTVDGQIVNEGEAVKIKEGIATAIRDQIKIYYKTPNEWIDEVFYGAPENTDYRDVNVKTVCNEPPPGVEVRMSDFAE